MSEIGARINHTIPTDPVQKPLHHSPDLVELWQRGHFTGVSCSFTFSFSWQVKATEKKKKRNQRLKGALRSGECRKKHPDSISQGKEKQVCQLFHRNL